MTVISSSSINRDFLFRAEVITKDLRLHYQWTWSYFRDSRFEGPSEEFTPIPEELYEDISDDPMELAASHQPN